MSEQKPLTEKESLALIASMLSKAKNSYIESGVGPLYWGILITLCSLLNYAEVTLQFTIGFDIWLLAFFALIPQLFYAIRSKKQKKFTAHEESIMNFVWSTFAICMFLLSFYNGVAHPAHSTALYMMVYGIPTFITGGVRKFKPMIIGGIVCWVCSLTSLYTSFPNSLLLMSLSSTSAWLIPGIILRIRYLKLKHV